MITWRNLIKGESPITKVSQLIRLLTSGCDVRNCSVEVVGDHLVMVPAGTVNLLNLTIAASSMVGTSYLLKVEGSEIVSLSLNEVCKIWNLTGDL